MVLLSFCLNFSQFQPGATLLIKKACSLVSIWELYIMFLYSDKIPVAYEISIDSKLEILRHLGVNLMQQLSMQVSF